MKLLILNLFNRRLKSRAFLSQKCSFPSISRNVLIINWQCPDVILESLDRWRIWPRFFRGKIKKGGMREDKMTSLNVARCEGLSERIWDKGRQADRVWREKFVPGLPSTNSNSRNRCRFSCGRTPYESWDRHWLWKLDPTRTSVPTMQFRFLGRYT